jgi:hypothetical protein
MAPGAVETAVGVRHAACLGRDHQVPARDQAADQLPQQVLRLAVPVHIGRVDERAARLPEGLQLLGGGFLAGVAAPGQGAEADPGNTQSGAAEMPLLHER